MLEWLIGIFFSKTIDFLNLRLVEENVLLSDRVLNLERQKAIVEQNIAFYQSKLPIFDEAITACKENKELSEFAELMHNLQQGMQHAPPQQ